MSKSNNGEDMSEPAFKQLLEKFKNQDLTRGSLEPVLVQPETNIRVSMNIAKVEQIAQEQIAQKNLLSKESEKLNVVSKVYYLEGQVEMEKIEAELHTFISKKEGKAYTLSFEKEEFEPVEDIQRSDVVGVYKFQPLQGVVKIVFIREDKKKFPVRFVINSLKLIKPKALNMDEWMKRDPQAGKQ